MFTPIAHVATALSFFVSAQLTLPSVSRMWVSEPAHRCSADYRDHRTAKAVPKKSKSTSGRSASPAVQIVTFGP